MRPPDRENPENADLGRLLGGLLRFGEIDSVDLDAGKAVVRDGEAMTPPLDWIMPIGDTSVWMAPTVGAQVMVLCPEADPAQGVILNGLRSSAFAPLFGGASAVIRFRDGATLTYDPGRSHLTFDLPGAMTLTAPDGLVIRADVEIQGDIAITGDATLTGDLKAEGDVSADGVSLKTHRHTGVAAGSAVSGGPAA